MGGASKHVNAEAAEAIGSLSDKITGTWSYWDGEKDVIQTNEMLAQYLPTEERQGLQGGPQTITTKIIMRLPQVGGQHP